MATIDNYKIKITVDGKDQVVDLNQNLDKLQSNLTRTASAGVAAFTALAVSAVRAAGDMVDLADALGVSAAKLYQLNIALEESGGKFGEGGNLLRGFTQSLGDVEKGSQETIDALYKLGLSRQQIENLGDEQLFQEVVNGLGKMEAGFERNRLAMVLLGKSAAGLDFEKLAAGTSKAVDPNLERNLRLADDALDKLNETFRTFQAVALEAIAPVLTAISNLNINTDDARKAIQIFGALIAGAFAAATVMQIVKVVEAMKTLVTVLRAAGAAQAFFVGLSGVGLAAVAASAAAATAAYIALGKAMEDAGATPTPGGTAPAVPSTTPGDGKKRTIGQTPEDKALKAAQATTLELQKQNVAAIAYQNTINDTIGLSQEIAEGIKINAKLEQDLANNAANYQKQIDTEKAKQEKANAGIILELQKQKDEMDAQLVSMAKLKIEELTRQQAIKQNTVELQKQLGIIEQEKQLTISNLEAVTNARMIAGEISQQEANNINAINKIREDGLAKTRALQKQLANETDTIRKQELQNQLDATKQATDFAISEKQREIAEKKKLEESSTAGVMQALQDIEKQITPFNMAQEQTNLLFQRMNQGITDFATNGKLKFKDFALSLIRDLILIEVRAQASKFLISLFRNMFGGGFGTGNAFGNLDLGMFLAEGGPAKAGKPYIVGEKGPELFVPKSAGTVIPNNQIGSRGVSAGAVSAPITNNYVTNNVNAIDSQSVAQFFANNRKLMLGSVEMARKEMPYGMSR